jgi:hypothetical protein
MEGHAKMAPGVLKLIGELVLEAKRIDTENIRLRDADQSSVSEEPLEAAPQIQEPESMQIELRLERLEDAVESLRCVIEDVQCDLNHLDCEIREDRRPLDET